MTCESSVDNSIDMYVANAGSDIDILFKHCWPVLSLLKITSASVE